MENWENSELHSALMLDAIFSASNLVLIISRLTPTADCPLMVSRIRRTLEAPTFLRKGVGASLLPCCRKFGSAHLQEVSGIGPRKSRKLRLFRDGGEGAGVERTLNHSLPISYALYKAAIKNNPERLVILCDRSRILARSDQAETTPQTPL